MPVSTLEITGKYLGERFRFNNDDGDVIVGEIDCSGIENNPKQADGRLAIKGPIVDDELSTNLIYRFFGRFVQYRNKRTGSTEQQFAFSSCVASKPVGEIAIVAYLAKHGEGLRFGEARARLVYEQFGEGAVRITRTEPKRIVEVLQRAGRPVSLTNCEELSRRLKKSQRTEATKLEVSSLLNGRGFPKTLVDSVIQKWGSKAASVIARDPYKLLSFSGCGFKTCDAMYLGLGLNPARMKRQALCAWHAIHSDNNGHTWLPKTVPLMSLRANIGGARLRPERAVQLALRAKLLAEREEHLAEHENMLNEKLISSSVRSAKSERVFWPSVEKLELYEHQFGILKKTLRSPICILGGSPGTGKTWAVCELVLALARTIGLDQIAIGAPTGKAAVRVTENLASKGIDLQARTWHSLLMQLERIGSSKFGSKVLIGDESSMIDTNLMSRIFGHREVDTHLLLVGDVNQLPPVGHGAPLRDLINAGVPYGELTEIIRNSGGIVEACAAIRDCQSWTPGGNLIVKPTTCSHVDLITQTLQEAEDSGLDPVWDVQVVTAVNEKSELSRKSLNSLLQPILNTSPGGPTRFRVGDKIVNTKNGFFRPVGTSTEDVDENEKGEVYVANGELAEVTSVDGRAFTCRLTAPKREVQAFIGQEGGCTWELGYALSVHKSQGSDWPWVIVVLDDYPGARRVCDRSWLYTAISRAKSRCILIGDQQVANRMTRSSKIWHRKTFLRDLILEQNARECLANV